MSENITNIKARQLEKDMFQHYESVSDSFMNMFDLYHNALSKDEAEKLNQEITSHEKHLVFIMDIGADGIPNAWIYTRKPEQDEGGDLLFNITGKGKGEAN